MVGGKNENLQNLGCGRGENYHIRMVGGRDEKPTLSGCWLGEIKTIIPGWWEEVVEYLPYPDGWRKWLSSYRIRMVGGSG
jgi:hypothetical protein